MLLPEVELSGFPLQNALLQKENHQSWAGKEGHFWEAISPLTTHSRKEYFGAIRFHPIKLVS